MDRFRQHGIHPNIGTNIVAEYSNPTTKVWFNQRGGRIYKIIYDPKTRQYTENVIDYNQVIKN